MLRQDPSPSHGRTSGRGRISLGFASVVATVALVGVGPASAGIGLCVGTSCGSGSVGNTGETVYGVTGLGAVAPGAPVFGYNPMTGFNDVLLSPGNGFPIWDPSAANTIVSTGLVSQPVISAKVGGANDNGAFGVGLTTALGPIVSFLLKGAAAKPGPSPTDFAVTSWTTHYEVFGHGFSGDMVSYLAALGAWQQGAASIGAVSLVQNYYVNGAYEGQAAPMVLAATGTGVSQTSGGPLSIMVGPTGFVGLDYDVLPLTAQVGDSITVVTTLTEYAQGATLVPFSIGAVSGLPGYTGSQDPNSYFDANSTPEPATWAMMLLGVAGIGAMVRRRRLSAPAGWPAPRVDARDI